MPDRWFDGHLDLASLVEKGRDMHAPIESCRGELLPAAVTLPELREANVRACLGTIFTEAIDPDDPNAETCGYAYAAGDAEAAWMAGMRQLKLYQAWAAAGVIALMQERESERTREREREERRRDGETERRSAPEGGRHEGTEARRHEGGSAPLRLGILMECADPIRSPEEAEWWAEQGVVAVGMAWWRQGRYAGGNGVGTGLTDLGRELAPELDRLGVVHDLSHLSQKATEELLSLTDATVIASHSNCRELLGGRENPAWERHLADETIAEIARRGGVIGVNLVRNFLTYPCGRDERPPLDAAVDHIEYICDIAGHRRAVALGSDMDGGITANDLPEGVDRATHLPRLAERLRARGWGEEEIEGFRWGNWARFWGA